MPAARRRAVPAWGLLSAFTLVLLGAYYVSPLSADVAATDLLYDCFPLLTIAGGIVAARRGDRAHRIAWWVFTGGALLMFVGDVSWTALALSGDESYPTIADAFYLGGYLVLATAIWWVCTPRPLADLEGLVDAIIVAIAGSLVLWFLVIRPNLDGDATMLAKVVAVAAPAVNVALLGIVARILLGRHHLTFTAYALIGAITLYFAADVTYALQMLQGTYEGGIVDLGWMLGYALFGIAAAHPRSAAPVIETSREVGFSRWRLLMLAGATMLAPVVALAQIGADDPISLAWAIVCSIALFLLVVLRMGGAFAKVKRTLVQRAALEAQLRHQARHDPLTGLGNRAQLTEELEAAIASHPGRVAVALIDLDDFKSVNDTLGHQAGDALLVEAAGRLAADARSGDSAARLGGDEFALVLVDLTEEEALGAVTRRLTHLRRGYQLDDRTVFIDGSAGVAMAGPGSEPGDLIRDADIAMYLAKSQGKGRVEPFKAKLRTDVVQRVQMRAELARAIDEEELVVHYQPIVGLGSRQVEKLEALVRWEHPTMGLIPPGEFIPLAEMTGLIIPLGRWVLREACARAAEWNQVAGRRIGISVNVAAPQLRHAAFLGDVRMILHVTGLDPDLLTLELTESDVIELESAGRALAALRSLGVHLAIDDFGTGYSSLSYLAELPIDLIKIDRRFVQALLGGEQGREIASTIVAIGRNLHVETVAEGIEEEGQLAALVALGCGLGQGFYFARPVEAAAIPALVARGFEDAPAPGEAAA